MNEEDGITFDKQKEFIDDEKLSKWTIKVFGIGSIGSNLVKQLALVGFKNIVVYDFDTVDLDNIGSQEFRLPHVGMKKTEAMVKLMKDDFNFNITAFEGEITKETMVMPEHNTIYFCGFDSLEARTMLWNKLKDFPIVWGESRIGRTAQRFYFVDLRKTDEKSLKWKETYEKSLDPNGPRTELTCGEKGTYPSNSELVGKLVKQFVNIGEGKNMATHMISDWGLPPAIFIAPIEEVPSEMNY